MKVMKTLVIMFSIISLIVSMPLKGNASESETKTTILIDPGHGGIDGGAKSKNGTIEKEINLAIAIKLRKELESLNYNVYMTREQDLELNTKKVKDLDERCKMKKETNCDIFVSIHQNMFPQASCFGAQVWYASNSESSILAECIQSSLKTTIEDNNKRIPKPAKEQYRILRDGYNGACVIVECGFLSNRKEELNLKSDEYQDKIVKGIVEGIEDYIKKINN